MARRKGRAVSETVGIAPVQFPSGTIIPFAGATAPLGWAICDGNTVSRTEYAGLYAAIGDAWGNGNGTTTFHLPDLRGKFLRGVDKDSLGNPTTPAVDPDRNTRTPSAFGGNVGNNVGSMQGHAFQTHDHGITSYGGSGGYGSIVDGARFNPQTVNSQSRAASGAQSQPTPNETRPINANVNYIIKL